MSSSRQLAAILFADIQGYTAMMQEDEMKATLLRDKLKNILEDEVRAHHGRVLKLSGDGALCIFNSAIEATYAAIAIQKYMSEDPKVPLRIGIHSGDVMFEEGDVHGDGVNIASRIESFAVPGSVFISGKLHDEIKNQKNIDTISLGRFDLKNVSEPVEIYAVSNEGLVVPQKKILVGKGGKYSGTKTPSHTWMILMTIITVTSIVAFFLYKKTQTAQLTGIEKSIAVLPFTNMSGDMDNEYFSDGITEDIITRLSQVSDLKVISRTSVMRFKNTTKNIKDIASELDVASILEGSVQKSGNKLRITAQLINAQSDEHLWAEKYDVELKDIFQVQSDVSELIALSLKATLTAFQKSRIEKKPTENLEAYNLYLRANYLWNKQTLESIGQAADLYKQAIKLDSNFAQAYAATAIASVSGGLRESSWEEHLENIHKNAEHAVSLDSNLASAHTALGQFYFMSPSLNDSIMAMKEFDKAIELDPNYAHAWTYKGWLYELNYEFEKAMPFVATALNLDPLSPIRMISMAKYYAMFGRAPESIELIRKIETMEPEMRFLSKMKPEIYFNAGEYEQWMQLVESKETSRVIDHYDYLKLRAVYYAVKGERAKSQAVLDSCSGLRNGFPDLILVAACQYWLGEKDKAYKTLKTDLAKYPEVKWNWLKQVCSNYVLTPILLDWKFEAIKKECGWKPLE